MFATTRKKWIGRELRELSDAIDEASDRERFEKFAERSSLKMPRGATGITADDVRDVVKLIGYPVLITSSLRIRGKRHGNLANVEQLEAYLQKHIWRRISHC